VAAREPPPATIPSPSMTLWVPPAEATEQEEESKSMASSVASLVARWRGRVGATGGTQARWWWQWRVGAGRARGELRWGDAGSDDVFR
jgi:hypothetical protein